MDSAAEFAQEVPLPLVFVLGTKSAQEYIIKSYEQMTFPKKCPYIVFNV